MSSTDNVTPIHEKSEEERLRIARAVFPRWSSFPSLAQLEARFPPRQLPPGAMVTRVGPSPTGMMHLGGLYAALINERMASQSGGLFYLRIEDTDQRRTVSGALETIVDAIADYGLNAVEGPRRGPSGGVVQVGEYGPYIQSERLPIYHPVAYHMMRHGRLYPCFMTEAEIEEIRALQRQENLRPGIYGRWAEPSRRLTATQVERAVSEGRPFVVRLRSDAPEGAEVRWDDAIRGGMTMPAHPLDNVLIKSDGIPTYHLAHLVDDQLMRTTHVIRGEEWLSSVPLHIQLHEAIGWQPPVYGHVAAIHKQDGGSRRKLSKRSDPEADVNYYWEAGFPREAVLEYLTNLANGEFEGWRSNHPDAPRKEFPLSLDGMSTGGPLSDLNKLRNVSRHLISRLSGQDLYAQVLQWTKQYEPRLAAVIEADEEFTIRALEVHRVGTDDAKRLVTLADVRTHLTPFFDEWLPPVESLEFPPNVGPDERTQVLHAMDSLYRAPVDAGAVFPLVQRIAEELGFAPSMKAYKAEPTKYRGHVGDVAMILRVALFGSTRSPDLGQVMTVLGPERVSRRLRRVLDT